MNNGAKLLYLETLLITFISADVLICGSILVHGLRGCLLMKRTQILCTRLRGLELSVYLHNPLLVVSHLLSQRNKSINMRKYHTQCYLLNLFS